MARTKTELRWEARFREVLAGSSRDYETTGEMVYGVLREAIITGALAPGEWLRQATLAEAIGVSRIPVRTALMRLDADGLLTFSPRQGARVRMLSLARIDEVYRLRTVIESYAMSLSIASLTPARLETLRSLADELDSGAEGAELVEARDSFYAELYDDANNPILAEIVAGLRDRVNRGLLSYRLPGAAPDTYRTLVEHLAAGDVPAAQRWLDRHLLEVRSHLRDIFAAEESP